MSIDDIKNITIPLKSLNPLDKDNKLWLEDTSAKKCYLCNKPFVDGITTGKHHCRNCGKIVCGSCSSKKYKFSGNLFGDRVCDLCYNCVLNTTKTSTECINYLQNQKLKERKSKQYIYKWGDNFYMITPGTQSGLYTKNSDIIVKLDTGKTISITFTEDRDSNLKGSVISSQDEGGIKLNVTESNNIEYPINSTIILENVPENSDLERSNKTMTSIQVKNMVNGEPKIAYLSEPFQMNGGYKHRKNKSKRKSKRSVRRRVSKRSNVRCKKVTKRLRKMRRRMLR
jgi:hypothetical protein